MTFPVSTLTAAVAALQTQTQTQVTNGEGANAGAVQVVIGEEGSDAPNDLIVIATNVRRTVTHEAFLGSLQAGSLEEKYTIDVLCSAWTGDNDPITNMDRCLTLVGYVEVAVRTDPSLGGSVVIARPAGTTGTQSYVTPTPIGRQCDTIVSIFVDTLN